MLSMVSLDLEQSLQKSFDLAANYLGIEAPEVSISRDFDLHRLIGQDVTALSALFGEDIIDRDEFRQILVDGEILPAANQAEAVAPETPESNEMSSDQIDRLIDALTR
jgi:hypothetical protein